MSERDRLLLAFLAEQRMAVVPQVQTLLRVSRSGAEARLRRLERRGLVKRQRIFQGHPAACWITRQGLGTIGRRLPAPKVNLAVYRHDVGVAWLWLAARGGAFGALAAVRSEREMRSEDRRLPAGRRPHGVGLGLPGPRGGRQLHYPDLILEMEGGRRVAVELELTGKGRRRLERIMRSYAADRRIDAVVYLVPRGQIGQQVAAAARRAGIGALVHVQYLAPGSPAGVPEPGRPLIRGAQGLGRTGAREAGR